MPHTTTDTFLNGRLQVAQHRDGYRFSLDAVLLAGTIQPKVGESIIDLGTGCAIIPLILGYRFPKVRIRAVEFQDELVQLANTNVADNHMQDRIVIMKEDVRRIDAGMVAGPCDWVISNPPFYPADSGRINPSGQKAMARHETHLKLTELLEAVRRLLRTGGGFATIYPSERAATLLSTMCAMGIEPKWLQTIHSRPNQVAKLILVKGVMAGKPGIQVDRPLVIYDDDGLYTDEVQAMMAP